MKLTKIFITILIISLIFQIPNSSAEESKFSLQILDNNGLKQYSDSNWTLNCEEASGNSITIVTQSTEGRTWIEMTHLQEGIWSGEGFEQLDKEDNIYHFQLTDDGRYRIKLYNEYNNKTRYRYYYVESIGGDGTYASGDVQLLLDKGEWVDSMMYKYEESWPHFRQWGENAFRFYSNPAYVITDFLKQVPIFLLMPQVWFIILVVIALVIWRYRKRVRVTQHDRQLTKKHGTREDLIREKRKAQEEKRLRSLTTMPLDYALKKYGDGDWLPRAVCYHEGVPEKGASYPTAYSLALELGGNLFSKYPERKERAKEIVEEMIDRHSGILEKAWIYKDISACARAVSAESVDVTSRPIVKDKFMRISDLADEQAKIESAELSKRLKVETGTEKPLSDIITSTEKELEKKGMDTAKKEQQSKIKKPKDKGDKD
jgi:uncharacterized membrane protein